MTHDELRDYIDKFDAAGMVNEPAIKALRAVVELHFPSEGCCYVCIKEISVIGHTTNGEEIWTNIENYDYPCPTIQAIEKELG